MSVACAPAADGLPRDGAIDGFVPVDDNARWMLQGEVTAASAPGIFDASSAMPLPTSGVIDCDGVRLVDSTAVALLLAMKRRGKSEQRPITLANVPPPLVALASVYGVADLLVR